MTGRKLLERRSDGGDGEEQVEELEEGGGCGFVEDNSLDLQVGVVRPFLLLGNLFLSTCIVSGTPHNFVFPFSHSFLSPPPPFVSFIFL